MQRLPSPDKNLQGFKTWQFGINICGVWNTWVILQRTQVHSTVQCQWWKFNCNPKYKVPRIMEKNLRIIRKWSEIYWLTQWEHHDDVFLFERKKQAPEIYCPHNLSETAFEPEVVTSVEHGGFEVVFKLGSYQNRNLPPKFCCSL